MNSEIYQAVYTTLSSGVTQEVYDNVPQDLDNSQYPYIRLEGTDQLPWDTDDENGFFGSFRVHVWSRYKGQKEVEEIQKNVYDALHRVSIADTTNFQIVGVIQERSNILLDPDGETRHGVQQYRIIYEEN